MRLAGLAAAAFVALLVASAHAQPPADEGRQSTAPALDPVVATAPAALSATPAPVPDEVTAAASRSVAYQVGSATLTNTVVTNGPVADTPENRAKYGQPMSRAGKRSGARGN
ncbi:MAG: hypothetical protein ACK547_03015 [Alphaproteobacteria bacterium]